jgi:hypothetical protein
MTIVNTNAEDAHKYFEISQQWDRHQYHSLAYQRFEYLLNRLKALEIPILVTGPDQIFIELNWTETLQLLIDFANEKVFQSFNLYLEMTEASAKSSIK